MTTILCLASYFKGGRFLEQCKRAGCHTILITVEKLKDELWPWAAIDEFFMLPFASLHHQPDLTHAVAYLARDRQIASIVALDDYDVELAAALREHMRLPGMGDSAARFFRDKLAMRVQAHRQGVSVPDFVPVLNYAHIRDFLAQVSAPWVLKPRSEASAMGIKKLYHADEVWVALNELGDRQSYYVLEQFLPGDVYHVDSIVFDGQIGFARSSKYGLPPMTVYQGGGVFVTSTLPIGGAEDTALQRLNQHLIAAMGMVRGVTHAEFIRSHADGQYYFLEIAARVGGAGIDLMLEYASGINLWEAWAELEISQVQGRDYRLPSTHDHHAALLVSLARQPWPDTSAYTDSELVWRMSKAYHVGLILASPDAERVQALVSAYIPRIAADFATSAPPLDRPPG